VTLPETEQLITDYLRSGHDNLLRKSILDKLKKTESANPELIAGILATMEPPFADLPPEDAEHPGLYRFSIPNPLTVPGLPKLYGADEIRYAVQLPPDYSPHQRYPMIVSLNGSQTPETQLDWWSGSWQNGQRMGHATRHGYIVIAPDWNPAEIQQSDYDFSVFPHAAVLGSVKDAFRRFNVNTDKVFLSGHGIGGTAAWDMALAHPDLWAGAVAFNAVGSKYIDLYRAATRHVSLYLVWGEMEGAGTRRKWDINAPILNRYLQKQAHPGDVTAVRYIGRGMEGFSEEILNIFDWMKVRQRNFIPFEFEAETMRSWDSFFWWVEMPGLAADRPENMFDPVDFPAEKDAVRKLVTLKSNLYKATNRISVDIKPKVNNVQIFLMPDMIDMKAKCQVRVNDKQYAPANGMIEPDIEVMLEDVRTRCDRLHPFWVMLTKK
jgi:pimeloyl-ACP methyl ester carboxylesterase